MSQTISYTINGKYTIYNCRTRTNGNKTVHIGTTLKQCFKPVNIILLVCKKYRDKQNKLCHTKCNGIFIAVEKFAVKIRHRNTKHIIYHMTHRYVHKRHKTYDGNYQPQFHFLFGFLMLLIYFIIFFGFFSFFILPFYSGSISCVNNCFYYIF